ncbi:ChbG/HpnK family deacetylase [Virgibacillus oceani]|uniref:Carbohydrate deacetylase n=1 Tax=Virgibacillus oceani TaxID=1479511 RepID=A0A917HQJ8_9BACI|nr:ChbG/HpnK family deacetylase [Virgibacillus oceani]GGG85937.1 carbohydrate deacetylase [Virgibacillus oceani]
MHNSATRLIVNADDYGFSPGVSAGILYAHKHGILTSTTLMVNTDYSKQSLDEVKQYPNLGVGLHFVMDAGKPISSSVSSLTDHSGNFLKGKTLIESAKKQDIKEELVEQLELLYKWGIDVTHIDSHHHMHLHIPHALEAVVEVAESYNLPIRSFSETQLNGVIMSSDYFYYDFYGEENVSTAYLLKLFSKLKPGISEVMCHPAFMDLNLRNQSSYHFPRIKELEVLVDHRINSWLKEHSIELIHYGGL